jgi:methanogenic corrinoid protein MtbC1
MVESEIIPRLMLAHRSSAANDDGRRALKPVLGEETTDAFARLAASHDSQSLVAFVGDLLSAGVSREQILMDLLVPTARRLGEYWNDDTASYADVTVGLGRLQQLVRTLGGAPMENDVEGGSALSAVFAPAPDEQHTFGLFIVEDCFRRAGWRTWIETSPHQDDLLETVRLHWFDVFGLTASNDIPPARVAQQIRAVRAASRNPDLFVLFGGRLSLEQPEFAKAVGADARAEDGDHALLVAHQALLLGGNALRREA